MALFPIACRELNEAALGRRFVRLAEPHGRFELRLRGPTPGYPGAFASLMDDLV